MTNLNKHSARAPDLLEPNQSGSNALSPNRSKQ